MKVERAVAYVFDPQTEQEKIADFIETHDPATWKQVPHPYDENKIVFYKVEKLHADGHWRDNEFLGDKSVIVR